MLPRYPLVLVSFFLVAIQLHAQVGGPFASGPWSGNVTPTSATVAVHLAASNAQVRLAVSTRADLSNAVYSTGIVTDADSGNRAKLDVAGLTPDTDYYYGFEVNGTLRAEPLSRGQFHTFPQGASSFKIVFASCGDFRASNQTAYDAIVAEKPLMFLNTGDLHYSNTDSTDVADYRANYDGVLNQPSQAAVYRNMAMAYMWDDHDFTGNDSDGTFVGRDTARRAYEESVPHYPYGVHSGPIGQAFTIGRVRFIVTDLRSAASPHESLDDVNKVHMGATQKAWFKQELIAARDAGFPMIVWVSTVPWIGAAGSGDDDWSVYSTERRDLANFIKANGIKNLTLICGDMHALAYDNGQHSDYADGGGAPLVVLQAAALTSPGSVKGGPYTGGPFPGSQQYGVLEVTDTGAPTLQVRFTGKHVGDVAPRLTYNFSSTSPTAIASAVMSATPVTPATNISSTTAGFTNVSTLDRITGADGVTIAGFVITGKSTRNVLIRAVGPSLANFGVNDALKDPILDVRQGKTLIASNDDWGSGGAASSLSTVFTKAGAFQYASANSKDSALFLTLAPGVYSAVVHSSDNGFGRVLVEIYEVP